MSEGPRPYTLVAELTHRCPLHCPYCSNPRELDTRADELSTDDWRRVIDQAEALGVVQMHLTGGEPLARGDLEAIAAHARGRELYVQLVTSGVPLTRARLAALKDAGVDAVQLSVQDAQAQGADRIAGYEGHAHKLEVARWVKELGLPLTINVVMHRANLDGTAEIVTLAEQLGADRLELANTQYHGWALGNRAALMPEIDQLARAAEVARAAKERLLGTMEVLFVKPDYFETRPRACMDGWARRFVVVAPSGRVYPCQSAAAITTLHWENVRERSLEWIWNESSAMNAFRGEAWMPEPCKSCDRRAIDFGGCRCQAFQLTGDAAATDPACALAPAHALVARARTDGVTAEPRYLYRGK